MDDKLSFNDHVDYIVRKSYQMLGFIFRCGRHFSKQSSMKLLYSSLVRNRLEYCSTVWNPYYANACDHIERVQRKFTRMFYYKFGIANPRPPYHERLKALKLHSLETRRLESDELMLYKLIHKRVDSTLSQRIAFHQPSRATRQNSLFYLPNVTTNIQLNSPIHRIQRNHMQFFRNMDIVGMRQMAFIRIVRGSYDW